jgi:hypothetical protein
MEPLDDIFKDAVCPEKTFRPLFRLLQEHLPEGRFQVVFYDGQKAPVGDGVDLADEVRRQALEDLKKKPDPPAPPPRLRWTGGLRRPAGGLGCRLVF